MKLRSVQTLLFSSFVGIVILSLAIFVVLASPRIYETAIVQISNDLYKQALLASSDYATALQKGMDRNTLEQMARQTAKLSGSRVTLIEKRGKVLADSDVPIEKLNSLENHLDRPEIIDAQKYGRGKAVRYSATLGKNLIYIALPLKDSRHQIIGFLRFSITPVYASDLTAKINRSGLASLIIAILFAVILSVFLAHAYSLPIMRLSGVAKKISQGDFPQTILRKSRFEIRKLEEAVEAMSQRLAESFSSLTAERSQIAAILSSMSEGVLAVDQNGRLIMANPAIERTFSVVEPEILGKTVRASLRNNEISELIEESLEENKLLKTDINMVTPIEASFVAHASPIVGQKGKILGVVCVLHDVTEIKKLENYRSEFVANVSHELKTPLTVIHSYVETLLGGAIDDKEHNREFLAKIDSIFFFV